MVSKVNRQLLHDNRSLNTIECFNLRRNNKINVRNLNNSQISNPETHRFQFKYIKYVCIKSHWDGCVNRMKQNERKCILVLS